MTMAGIFGTQAQAPGSLMSGFRNLLDPAVAMPVAAALMGNLGNMGNFGQAFGAAGQAFAQTREKNKQLAEQAKTYEWFKQNAPEYAQLIDGGAPIDQVWKHYTEQRFAKPTETYNILTDDEEARLGLPTDNAYQRSSQGGRISQIGGGGTTVNLSDGMKLTEGQSKDIGYFTRGLYANDELASLENELTSLPGFVAGQMGVPGNFYKGSGYRQAERAGREVLAVILRKDTGAAVTQQEFDLYGPMYLPWPGDDAATVAAKREARERAIDAMELGLGTATPLAKDVRTKFGADRASQKSKTPVPGTVEDGYRFKGGNPADPNNWEPAQ